MKNHCLVVLAWLIISQIMNNVSARTTLNYDTLIGARANPNGLALQSSMQLQSNLYDSQLDIYKHNHIASSVLIGLSPANFKFGVRITLQPLSVFSVYTQLVGNHYYGTLGRIQSFSRSTEDFSDKAQKRRAIDNLNYSSIGLQMVLGGKFQIKVKSFAFISNLRGYWQNFGLQRDDPYYYDSELDTLTPNQGWVFHSDTDALFLGNRKFLLGIRHTYVLPISPSDDTTFKANHRVGPLVGWRIASESGPNTILEELLLVGLVNWYLEHPYRTNSPAIPYVGFGVKLKGQLIGLAN